MSLLSPRPRRLEQLRMGLALLGGCLVSVGCEPPLVVGDLTCPPSEGGAAAKNAKGVFNDGPLPAPWSTSFDDGFCGYKYQAGFCYGDPDASYRLVTSPVHSGPFAAAFDLVPSGTKGTKQVRCVREGALPTAAYYGAWYYVPSALTATHDFNLFYFPGGEPGQLLGGLWDVSMDDSSGRLAAYVFGHKLGRYDQATPKPIPLDRWFQLEFYLKRAADATGEMALYQDGEELIRVTGVITDSTAFGQWYVGILANSLASTPPISSVYVDDVTVRLP